MKQTPLENLDCETVTHDNRKETEQHNEVVGISDVLAVESQRICITGGSLNVKCVSLIVFNSDVVGKKYLENLKQFHGHSTLYGEAGIQALYLSNLNTPLEHGQMGIQAVNPSDFNAHSAASKSVLQTMYKHG